MSARPAPARTRRPATPRRRRRTRAALARRWALLLGAAALAAVLISAAIYPFLDKAVHEVTLPLRHEDLIRRQAPAKHLDPPLLAAVMYTESRFRNQSSNAGAKG